MEGPKCWAEEELSRAWVLLTWPQSSFVVQDQHSFHSISWRHHRQLSWKLSYLGLLEPWGSLLPLSCFRTWDPPGMVLRLCPALWLTPGWHGNQSGIGTELTFLTSFSLKIHGKLAAGIEWKFKKFRSWWNWLSYSKDFYHSLYSHLTSTPCHLPSPHSSLRGHICGT